MKFPLKLNLRVLTTITLIVTLTLGCFAFGQWTATEANAENPTYETRSLASVVAQTTSTLSNDTNWAGYIVASDLQNPQATVTSVSASWTVPTITPSSTDAYSAVWIGIGGFFDNTLIQTGTEQDSIQGQSQYSAWVEVLPQTSLTIDNITVSPGDQISASIQLVDSNTDDWSIDVKDLTTNQDYKSSIYYSSSQLSAEWIVERPELSSRRSRGVLTALADVGTVKLTNCQAAIGGTTGTIGNFPVVQSVMYQTVEPTTNAGITQLAAVSDLTNGGSSFTVETSPSVIPELPVLILLPAVFGTCLLTFQIRKRAPRFFSVDATRQLTLTLLRS